MVSNTAIRKHTHDRCILPGSLVRSPPDCAATAVLSPIDIREKLLTGKPVLLVLNNVDVTTSRSARGSKVPVKLELPQISAVELTVPSVTR